jgi:hypothetical protein
MAKPKSSWVKTQFIGRGFVRLELRELMYKHIESPGVYVGYLQQACSVEEPWKFWFVPVESDEGFNMGCQRQEGPAVIHFSNTVDWIKDDEVQVSRFYKEGN